MVVKFNSQQKIVAVVAVRAGSQRVPKKNIRKFHDTNLLELKLKVLINCKQIDEIIVNSDSEEMLEIGQKFNVSTQKESLIMPVVRLVIQNSTGTLQKQLKEM